MEQTVAEMHALADATLAKWGIPVNAYTRSAFMLGLDAGHAQGLEDAEAITKRLLSDRFGGAMVGHSEQTKAR